MGLLDDAIREHLELKRKHGADPDEVGRQEREALGASRPQAEFAGPGEGVPAVAGGRKSRANASPASAASCRRRSSA